MIRRFALATCSGLLLTGFAAAREPPKPNQQSAPLANANQQSIADMAAQIRDLREELNASKEQLARIGNDEKNIEAGVTEQLNKSAAGVTEQLGRFAAAEPARLSTEMQPTIGWFNTFVAVGGGVASFFGALVTVTVVYFSLSSRREAIAAATDQAQIATKNLIQEAKITLKKQFDEHEQIFKDHLNTIDLEQRKILELRGKIDQAKTEADAAARSARDSVAEIEALKESGKRCLHDVLRKLGGQSPLAAHERAGPSEDEKEYIVLCKEAAAALDVGDVGTAFSNLQKAEEDAPNEELRLGAVDAQAQILFARGAIQDAINLVTDKLDRARKTRSDHELEPDLKLQIGKMLARLGLMHDARKMEDQALHCLDEATRLVEDSADVNALEIFGFAQNYRGYLLRQYHNYTEAIDSYRKVVNRCGTSRDAALRTLTAEAMYGEGEIFQAKGSIVQDKWRDLGKAGNDPQAKRKFLDAIACYEKLEDFAGDNDLHARTISADGLINAGILHTFLIEPTSEEAKPDEREPDERKLAIDTFGRVVTLFDRPNAEPSLLERVNRARDLRARLL